MPRLSIDGVSQQLIDESASESADRFVDLRIELRHRTTGAILGSPAGGRWDRVEREFVGEARRARAIPIHDGQVPAAMSFVTWLERYVEGRASAEDGAGAFSLAMAGGRRGGKSYLAAACASMYAVAVAESFPWVVCPIEDDFPEMVRYLQQFLHPSWYTYIETAGLFRLITGTVIELRSGHKPENLRRGECSFAVMNEAQKMAKRCYENLRLATADTGSMVVMAMNPPQSPIGRWAYEHVMRARAGKIDGVVHEFSSDSNPTIDRRAVTSLAKEMASRDYLIDVEGQFLPDIDSVMHAMSDDNVRPTPEMGDVTRAFLKRHFGREFDFWIGSDFQTLPHQVAIVEKAFAAPGCPCGDDHSWTVDEVLVENATEDDLIDELERRGYRGDRCAVIADASGEYQGSERKAGKFSFDVFRRRGWTFIYVPDPNSDKNPDILERIKIGNARLRTHDGHHHAFLDPRCLYTIDALKKWEMRRGFPYRRSEYAHRVDGWTYPKYRFWCHTRKMIPKVEYKSLGGSERAAEMKGWHGERDDEDE